MPDLVEAYFRKLLNLEGWKIYYINSKKGRLSIAFCYENKNGCYLYNSSRNKKFDYIVEIMCTNPLKNCYDIDTCIKKLHKTKSDTVISVQRLEE